MEIKRVVCGVGNNIEYIEGVSSNGPFAVINPREPVGRHVDGDFSTNCRLCVRCAGVELIRPCDWNTGIDLRPQKVLETEAIEKIPQYLREHLARQLDLQAIMDISKEKGPVNVDDIMELLKSKMRSPRNPRLFQLFEENIDLIRIGIGSVFPKEHTGLSNIIPQNKVVEDSRSRAKYLAKSFFPNIDK
jgi:hypothetical protein